MEISSKQAGIAIALIFLGMGVYGIFSQGIENIPFIGPMMGAMFTQGGTVAQTENTDGGTVEAVVPVGEGCPDVFQFSSLKYKMLDALNPRVGLSGITAEMLPLDAIASDPTRNIIDTGSTSSTGWVNFTTGAIETGETYKLVFYNATTIYDKIVTKKTPCLPVEKGALTVTEPVYGVKVGSFAAIYANSTYNINTTGKTGLQTVKISVTFGENASGAVVKDPVLILKTPEDYTLAPGVINSLYLQISSGSPVISSEYTKYNLIGWIDATPIPLMGSVELPDEPGSVFMGATDSAVYTLILTYDAGLADTSLSRLLIALDDLSGYDAVDDATRNSQATKRTLTIDFVA